MNHVIFDYETLGVDRLHNVTVLEVSFFTFNEERFLDRPYTFEEIDKDALTIKMDARQQKEKFNTDHERGAFDFWNQMDDAAKRRTFLPSKNDLTLEETLDKITEYLETNQPKYWWSRSNMFDPVILMGQYDHIGQLSKIKDLLPFYRVRDVRSFIDGYFGIESNGSSFIPVLDPKDEPALLSKFDKHYSRHDVAMDVLRLQMIHRNRHNKD